MRLLRVHIFLGIHNTKTYEAACKLMAKQVHLHLHFFLIFTLENISGLLLSIPFYTYVYFSAGCAGLFILPCDSFRQWHLLVGQVFDMIRPQTLDFVNFPISIWYSNPSFTTPDIWNLTFDSFSIFEPYFHFHNNSVFQRKYSTCWRVQSIQVLLFSP